MCWKWLDNWEVNEDCWEWELGMGILYNFEFLFLVKMANFELVLKLISIVQFGGKNECFGSNTPWGIGEKNK